jgi:hypothetical protein
VIITPDGKVLAEPYAYNLNPDEFVVFLEKGLAEFGKMNLAK